MQPLIELFPEGSFAHAYLQVRQLTAESRTLGHPWRTWALVRILPELEAAMLGHSLREELGHFDRPAAPPPRQAPRTEPAQTVYFASDRVDLNPRAVRIN